MRRHISDNANLQKQSLARISNFIAGIVITVASIVFAATTYADVENLDEAVARKARIATASCSSTLLENSSTGIWQAETLFYTDTATGNEVWKITNTSAVENSTQDIGNPQWSANGKWVSFASRRSTAKFNTYGSNIWMLAGTDGSKLQSAYNASSRSASWVAYFNWNPAKSDVFYGPGSNATAEGTDLKGIYYHTLDANGVISKSKILTVSSATNTRLSAKKSIAPDGSKLYVKDNYGSKVWVASLTGTPSFDTPNTGYDETLNIDTYWGGVSSWSGYHDQYLSGASNGVDGLWLNFMPEGTVNGPWWRSRLTGTGADSAPTHTQDRTAPYNWGGELEPLMTIGVSGVEADPWALDSDVNTNSHYPSHFVSDRWGRYIINGKFSQAPIGANIWDSRIKNDVVTFTTIPYTQHHDWSAWSDWSISSSASVANDYPAMVIVTQDYKNSNSQKSVAAAHVRYNETTPTTYNSLARPSQSPDGTKAMFHSTFLNSIDNAIQLFWTVAYYPYPPEIKSAAKNGSNVRLTWDFNQGTSCANQSTNSTRIGPTPNLTTPRTYATRGWPHEKLDCPPSPREIDKFRVWVSTDNNVWSPLGTTTYNNCRGNNECGMWTETAWTYDIAQPVNSTRYYAVSSLEHSGLESHTLSNVWKVTVDTNGGITQQTQQGAYPAEPGGKSNFYTTKPGSPNAVVFTHKQAPATAAGQYTITWNAPADRSMIRYYNIYAADGTVPSPMQQSKIASIPASSDYSGTGAYKYVDWLGNVDGSTKYVITSVDFQGNESAVARTGAPRSPVGVNRY